MIKLPNPFQKIKNWT